MRTYIIKIIVFNAKNISRAYNKIPRKKKGSGTKNCTGSIVITNCPWRSLVSLSDCCLRMSQQKMVGGRIRLVKTGRDLLTFLGKFVPLSRQEIKKSGSGAGLGGRSEERRVGEEWRRKLVEVSAMGER